MNTVVVVVVLAVTFAAAEVTGMQLREKEQELDLHLDQQGLDLSNYTIDVNNRNERCGF